MDWNTEYILFSWGLTAQGEQLTEVFKEYFSTKDIEKVDIDFEIEYEIDKAELLMKVVPSDDNVIIPWKETGMSEKEQPRDPILNRFDTSTWGRATNVSKGVELHTGRGAYKIIGKSCREIRGSYPERRAASVV